MAQRALYLRGIATTLSGDLIDETNSLLARDGVLFKVLDRCYITIQHC
jgi:hypothetical protein